MHLAKMNCYYVLINGKLKWDEAPLNTDEDVFRPEGFYCHRYVMASSPKAAEETAFARVRDNLDEDDWLKKSYASLTLEADEITVAPFYKLLKPENRGHSFYSEE